MMLQQYSKKINLNYDILPRSCSAIVGLMFICSFIFFVWSTNDFTWSLWSDRDLYRALNKNFDFWFLGPEFTQGTSTPGGMYYILLSLFHSLAESPLLIFKYLISLNFIVIILLISELKRHISTFSAIIAGVVVSSKVLVDPNVNQLWNPSFAFPLGCIGFVFILRWIRNPNNYAYIIIALTAFGVAAQCHFSFIYGAFLLLIIITTFDIKFKTNAVLYAISTLLILYAPYLFYVFAFSEVTVENFGEVKIHSSFTGAESNGLVYSLQNLYDFIFYPLREPLYFNKFFVNKVPFPDAASCVMWLIFAITPAVFVSGIAVSVFRRKVNKPLFKNKEIKTLFFSVLVGLTLLIAFDMFARGELVKRYLLWITPFVIFLFGYGLEIIIGSFKHFKRSGIRFFATFMIMFFITTYTAAAMRYVTTFIPKNEVVGPAYTDMLEIIKTLKNEIGMPTEDWETHVAGFYYNTQELAAGQGGLIGHRPFGYYFSASYFASQLLDEQTTTGNYKRKCVVIMQNEPKTEKSVALDTAKSVLSKAYYLQNSPNLKQLFISDNFTFFSFSPKFYSCPRNLTNNYVLLDEELETKNLINKFKNEKKYGENFTNVKRQNENETTIIFEVGDKTKFSVMLEIFFSKLSKLAVLNSRHLRGDDGTKQFEFLNPVLKFRSLETGRVTAVPIYQGRFGSSYRDRLLAKTPWTVSLDSISAGNYELHLSVENYREYIDDNWIGSFEILLATNIRLSND